MKGKLNCYKNTKIYVACPAFVATGGPELLHQIVYCLRKKLEIESFMYYFNFDKRKSNTPVHQAYEKYNNPYVTEIEKEEDIENNILIVPEVCESLALLSYFNKIRKVVWFLSVDNYYLTKMSDLNYFIIRLINKISKYIFKKIVINFDITSQEVLDKNIKKNNYKNDKLLDLANYFMFQSQYAQTHFYDLNPKYYLSDYLNEDFLKIQTNLSKKENIVVYNPKKGISFTEKLIEKGIDIKFIPLINMTRDEVIQMLQRAKIYIDFGNHPGKDRIPREAAILGCCIITGNRGAAAFFDDIPIKAEYKFEHCEENILKIIEKIKDCFANFEERYNDFEYYRETIKKEPKRFEEDLKNIFIKEQ